MTKRRSKNVEDIIESKRDLAREYAVENAPVRLDGKGEHPAIQAAASPEFATMSNADAAQIALQLQQIVRGQASILENQELFGTNLNKLEAKMKQYDEDARKWEEDRVKFLADINERADRLRVTDPSRRAEMATRVMNEEAEAMNMAKAIYATNKMKFEERIQRAPKVRVISPGVVESGRIGDQPITRVVAEVIRIKNYEWKLPPGVAVEVPDFVAQRFYDKQRQLAEFEERKAALSADRNGGAMSEASDVTRQMSKIDEKYGTTPVKG